MCCFSRPVASVSSTKIFARGLPDGRQALVYAMSFRAREELAMILPLPVPPQSVEDAVSFVSLEGYPTFFDDLSRLFPLVRSPLFLATGAARAPQALVVHDVGDFEASFVPTQADFKRLDARFKLAPDVWASVPRYADWGFAVFKLKPVPAPHVGLLARLFRKAPPAPPTRVHPMAFTFPRRDPKSVFFPTLHVHDGQVHSHAHFDHVLYSQLGEVPNAGQWDASDGPLAGSVDATRAKGLVDPALPAYRRTITGLHDNRDIELGPAG